jgi:protein TonB
MLRQVPRGRVYALLDISEDGRVTGCTVEHGSGSLTLDETTCQLLTTRARFRPALDRSGAPTTARFGQSVSWRLDQPNQQ